MNPAGLNQVGRNIEIKFVFEKGWIIKSKFRTCEIFLESSVLSRTEVDCVEVFGFVFVEKVFVIWFLESVRCNVAGNSIINMIVVIAYTNIVIKKQRLLVE